VEVTDNDIIHCSHKKDYATSLKSLSLGTNQNGQVLKALESCQWSSFCGGKALNFLSVINHFEQ